MADLKQLKTSARLAISGNCELRPLHDSDVTTGYVDGLNDELVNRHLVGSREYRQTMDSVRAYVRANDECDHDIFFGIFIDGALRGTVRLHDVDPIDGAARVGVLIFDREYWGHGWARRAIEAVLGFARTELGLRRFHAGMRSENAGSRRTFEKLGFVYQPELDWTDEHGGPHHFFVLETR